MLLQPIASCSTHGRRALTDSAAAPSGRLMCKVDSCCVHSPPDVAYRHLLQPEKDADGFFLNGRATWFEHPHTGSCGYGKRCRPPWRACLREGRCVSISCLPLCHPELRSARPGCSPLHSALYSSLSATAAAASTSMAPQPREGLLRRLKMPRAWGLPPKRHVGIRASRGKQCPFQLCLPRHLFCAVRGGSDAMSKASPCTRKHIFFASLGGR